LDDVESYIGDTIMVGEYSSSGSASEIRIDAIGFIRTLAITLGRNWCPQRMASQLLGEVKGNSWEIFSTLGQKKKDKAR
jgi:hypothetical protein